MKVNPTSGMAVPKHTGILVNQKTVESPHLKQLRKLWITAFTQLLCAWGNPWGYKTPFINTYRTNSTILRCSTNIWLIASWFMDTLLMENRLLLCFINLSIILSISSMLLL